MIRYRVITVAIAILGIAIGMILAVKLVDAGYLGASQEKLFSANTELQLANGQIAELKQEASELEAKLLEAEIESILCTRRPNSKQACRALNKRREACIEMYRDTDFRTSCMKPVIVGLKKYECDGYKDITTTQ